MLMEGGPEVILVLLLVLYKVEFVQVTLELDGGLASELYRMAYLSFPAGKHMARGRGMSMSCRV